MQASIQRCFERGFPFAVYRIPGKEPRLLVQTDGALRSFIPGDPFPLEKGYLMIPFHPSRAEPAYMLSPDILLSEDRPEQLPEGEASYSGWMPSPVIVEEDRKSYVKKVEKVRDTIRKVEGLEKVVLSRSERADKEAASSPWELFQRLDSLYPEAFVHLFHIPGQCTWTAATPELLLELDGEEARTQALAGTRPKGEGVEWTEKERREQASVEEHIASVLEEHGIPLRGRRGPETVDAGNIQHLSTRFVFSGEAVQKAPSAFIRDLHPTPAVCGLPRDRAMELIEATEARSRSFYAGAIGPWGVEGEHALYVNLRCARIWKEVIELFVGGGINDGSDPEKEWEETVRKAGTVRRAFS
ncbi:MAG: isochorismate synthase [Flavobacteriales bacterium]